MARRDGHLVKSEVESRNRTFDLGRIYMAKVKDVRNITKGGEVKVWVYTSDIPEEDESRWVIASYATSMFGTSPHNSNNNKGFENAVTSFGAWFPMTYIDNDVFIFYPCMHGENLKAYWFACPVDSDTNSMVPGIPSSFTQPTHDPLCEYNSKNQDSKAATRGSSNSTKDSEREIYLPLKNALDKQGLKNDLLRGISTAGSKRESPSMCYGILTPLGNSFVMDDGWEETDGRQNWNDGGDSLLKTDGLLPTQKVDTNRNNAGFRFRTRNGTQIMISDNGNIYLINRDGSAWVELSDDGYIDVFSESGINASSTGNINLHSKKKIIIEGEEGISLKGKELSIDVGITNIKSPKIQTDSELSVKNIQSTKGDIGTFTSVAAQINGVFAGTLDGTAFYATSAGTTPTPQPQPITIQPIVPNPIVEPIKQVVGKVGEMIATINTRVPTHEPYGEHKQVDGDKLSIDGQTLDIEHKPFKEPVRFGYSPIVSNQVETPDIEQTETKEDPNIPDLQLTEHVTLKDVCYSQTAMNAGINNTPPEAIIEKLRTTSQNIIEKVWVRFGKVQINSGYRGPQLNALVGGSSSSQHCKGEAVDIEVVGTSNYDLAVWIRDNLDFDQLILENATSLSTNPNSGWVHCSYVSPSKNRGQVLTIVGRTVKQGLVI